MDRPAHVLGAGGMDDLVLIDEGFALKDARDDLHMEVVGGPCQVTDRHRGVGNSLREQHLELGGGHHGDKIPALGAQPSP